MPCVFLYFPCVFPFCVVMCVSFVRVLAISRGKWPGRAGDKGAPTLNDMDDISDADDLPSSRCGADCVP